MESETKEWIEIIVWFALPIIFFGAIAGYEYTLGNFVVAAVFVILFAIVIIRRIVVTRKEIEPIIEAEMQVEKETNKELGPGSSSDGPKEASGPQ